MASKVFLHNKKSGRTYVYHNVSYWDKDEKKPKSKRKCIGHVDPVTGEIVPNRKKGDKRKEQLAAQEAEHTTQHSPETEQAAVSPVCSVLDCGVTTLLNQIAREIGLDTVLSRVFPQDSAAILTCAYYLVSECQALSRAEQWTAHTLTPCGGVLTDQRISELLQRITPSLTEDFFKAWIDWNRSQEYYCMDITSVSSYSEMKDEPLCFLRLQSGRRKSSANQSSDGYGAGKPYAPVLPRSAGQHPGCQHIGRESETSGTG